MTPAGDPQRQRQEQALAPVSAALLASASAQAGQLIEQARIAAAALGDKARSDAASAIRAAREEGMAQAAPLAAAELSHARRKARAARLQAEQRATKELQDRIRSAITGLRNDPGYGELRDRLAGLALQAAGPGAVLSEHPAGGVLARAPGVLVDCSLSRIAQRVIDALATRICEVAGHD
jgi:vacuolar-type H+-ATPase subunit E/Vma4